MLNREQIRKSFENMRTPGNFRMIQGSPIGDSRYSVAPQLVVNRLVRDVFKVSELK